MIEGKFKASHFVPEVSEVFRISVPICVTLLKKINCDKKLREEVHELRRENYKLKMENKEFQRFVFDGERREKRNMY